ncbi:MAG TPA: AIR synthase related protein [Tepidisphaeraceae bacterium]|nr:AIR synthase related protein [Tepidisphaeraceae bacterium]
MSSLSYEGSGVRYDRLDAFKRACQQAAATTVGALAKHGLNEPDKIRGESAYLIETHDGYLAHVEEGLGTKNLVADAMLGLTGKSYYANIGIDTVATIVNDMVTTGALPVSVAMHAGVGDAAWFENEQRAADLAKGFAEGCKKSDAVWGGGETPALKGIVDPSAIVLAGSAIGQIRNKAHRIVGDVCDRDAIVLLASTGVQTNGLTLCRRIADQLADGYLTKMDDGRTYGEALLDASAIYARFVAACQTHGVRLHYAAHITGHGWRKLMRLEEPFVYRMTNLGMGAPEVFNFIHQRGPVDVREMYATFNMGAGFAAFVSQGDVPRTIALALQSGHRAWVGGTVEKLGSRKAVEIEPLGITFEGDTLAVR